MAAEQPLFGPPPGWIEPAPAIAVKDLAKSTNFLPLFDEQVLIDGDTTVTYVDSAIYISSAEILNQRGTLSLPWRPAHGDLTIHRVEILRGDERIDTLKGDPGFTVLRREAGLERMIVDGSLTAVKHIEGLRVGDVLRFSISLSERDTMLGGRAQSAVLLVPKPIRIGFGRARLVWPQGQTVNLKAMVPGIDIAPKPIAGGRNELVIALPIATLPEMPKAMPARFQPVPVLVASTFASWSEVAGIMAPLYKADSAIPEGSDLAKAVDGIAKRSDDPVRRLADALQLVQEDVRYQLMALGTGNYAPQAPVETWQKRFGDCKAKTLLLLAVLHRLGIAAEPVLANTRQGDLVSTMLPSALAFDHVFVRAEIAGESFWLDGTAQGARFADIRDVPRFGHVLPLRDRDAALVALPVRANARPGASVDLALDHSAGPHLPVPFRLKVRYAGAWVAEVRVKDDADAEEALVTYAEKMANSWTDSTTITKPTAVFDPADATWTVSVEGVSYPDWQYRDSQYQLALNPTIRIDFEPDRSRSAWRQIPALIERPWTAHSRVELRLPDGGNGVLVEGAEAASLTNSAVTWDRTITRSGVTLVEEIVSRETGQEVAPGEISMVKKAIADAMAKQARVKLPSSYPHRWDDAQHRRSSPSLTRVKAVFDKRIAEKPLDAVRLDDRAWLSERLFDWTAAKADWSRAIVLDPTADRYVERAQLLTSLGDHAGALKDAQTAYEIDSGNKDVRKTLATALVRAGKLDEALDLNGPDPDLSTDDGQQALLDRVELLELGNRHDDAMALLDAALEKHPSVASFRNSRCWFRGLRNVDLDAALEDCNRAIELASDPAAYLDSRAMVHFRSGKTDSAMADLQGALLIEPELASSHFMRGVMLGRKGDAGAAKELEVARKLYPDIDNFMGHYGIKP